MVIHQNFAHQRILYEEILKSITVQEAVSQQLLFPLNLTFSNPHLAIVESIREQLEYTGFVFGDFKNESVEITGIPVGLKESNVESLLGQLIADFENDVPGEGFSQNDLLAKSLAKNMAIKSGTPMEPQAQEHLINQLFACKEPSVSPDNRPTIITLGASDFDKRFQ